VKRAAVVKDSRRDARHREGKLAAITRLHRQKFFCQQCKHCRNESQMV